MRKYLVPLVAAGVILLVLAIVVGNVAVARTNPPVTHTIEWDSPRTEQLARAACFDCHSHETVWPWYAHVAPMAFLVANDVNNAREEMNFSTGHDLFGDDMADMIEQGKMPLPQYLMLHPEANLSEEDKAALVEGLLDTFPVD